MGIEQLFRPGPRWTAPVEIALVSILVRLGPISYAQTPRVVVMHDFL